MMPQIETITKMTTMPHRIICPNFSPFILPWPLLKTEIKTPEKKMITPKSTKNVAPPLNMLASRLASSTRFFGAALVIKGTLNIIEPSIAAKEDLKSVFIQRVYDQEGRS